MKRVWLATILALAIAPLALAKGDASQGMTQALKAAGRFNTYLTLQAAAAQAPDPNVVGATQGQHTFLVPNDAAFAKLSPGTLEKLKDDPARLNAFLQTHTLPERMETAGMVVVAVQPANRTVKSLNGRQIELFRGKAAPGDAPVRLRLVGEPGAEPAARLGRFRDVTVAEGMVQEIDTVFASDELVGCGLHADSEACAGK